MAVRAAGNADTAVTAPTTSARMATSRVTSRIMPEGASRMASRRIVHATDFSSTSRAAFAMALRMARRERAELLVLHVLSAPAPLVADAYITPSVWNTLVRSQRAAAQRRLDALVDNARRPGVRASR